MNTDTDTTAAADIGDRQGNSSLPQPASTMAPRPITDRLEHRHLRHQAGSTQLGVAGGSTGDSGTGTDLEVDCGPSMVEDDLVSLLLHQHLREELDGPGAADDDSGTTPDAGDARDDPPPF